MKYRIVELSNGKFLAQYKTWWRWVSFRIDSYDPHYVFEFSRYVDHRYKHEAEYSIKKHKFPEPPITAVTIHYVEVKCPKLKARSSH